MRSLHLSLEKLKLIKFFSKNFALTFKIEIQIKYTVNLLFVTFL